MKYEILYYESWDVIQVIVYFTKLKNSRHKNERGSLQ
jgi:hypothetical protein